MKKVLKFIICFVILGISIVILYRYASLKDSEVFENIFNNLKYQKQEKLLEYQKCMDTPYKSEKLDLMFEELTKEYNVAIYFKDLNNDYTLNLNSTKVYYSASAAKLFDVIYLVEEAREGNINLNDTLTYKPSDARQGSIGMKQHKYNDKVAIIEMIKYMLLYSDNTAHFMLVNYIGVDTINEYFSDINLHFTKEQPFCNNYTTLMAIYSLERIYDILKIDDEYSKVIKDAMNNNNMNYLKFDNVNILHKYGYYDMYYHDIGIYDSDNPYLIAILTLYGNSNYQGKVKALSKGIYEIYSKNLEEKESICKKYLEA